MREDADRSVVDAGRGSEQGHPILCIKLRCRLCHGLLPSPALGERRHGALACRCVAVRGMPTMRRGAAVAASVASGAAASVALAAAWGQLIPGYGRPGGGVET